jgi:membrane protein implicated in regulation of membrane protease activity
LRFFSFFTLHWVILWLGLAAFALRRLLPMMGPCGRHYLGLLVLWGGLNLIYLVWFFYRKQASNSVEQYLGKNR